MMCFQNFMAHFLSSYRVWRWYRLRIFRKALLFNIWSKNLNWIFKWQMWVSCPSKLGHRLGHPFCCAFAQSNDDFFPAFVFLLVIFCCESVLYIWLALVYVDFFPVYAKKSYFFLLKLDRNLHTDASQI